MEKPFPKRTRTAIGDADTETVKFTSAYPESPDAADSQASYDPHRHLIETEFGWPEFEKWERINAGMKEIGLGLLLLAALIGFAIVCWEGVGYVYDSIFCVASG